MVEGLFFLARKPYPYSPQNRRASHIVLNVPAPLYAFGITVKGF